MSYPDQQQYPGYPPPQAPAAPAPYPPAPPQQGYPQQAPPQGYYQAPPQGYYQAPPPPQAPAPPRQHRTLADYLEQAAAGTKPLQWDRPGRQYVGMISGNEKVSFVVGRQGWWNFTSLNNNIP